MKAISQKIESISRKKMASVFFLLFLFISIETFSQDYRVAKAYIEDFGKNEMYVKKALIDYSITIVESFLDSRSEVTSQRIVEKLENINSNINHHDKGFKGNIELRDSFLRMNTKTIESMKNGILVLNDYNAQSLLTLDEIVLNLYKREAAIVAYFDEIKAFEKTKKEFGVKFNLSVRSYNNVNVFEYSAYQNILFYKMNVLDQKLMELINTKDEEGFTLCLAEMEKIKLQVESKTTELKFQFKDETLNNANIDYMLFLSNQNERIASHYNEFVDAYHVLQTLKIQSVGIQETNETILEYNKAVRLYNYKKNLFYMILEEIQKDKKRLYNEWFKVNAEFLKNNIEFENIHNSFVTNDD